MSSRKQDLLGLLIDTALQQADDDPMFDGQGRTGLLVPRDADISDDTEEDDAFTALREDLSPGEASEEVETMRPLSDAEMKILSETPGLRKLTRVDDAEQEDYIIAHSRKGYQGMDDILDDAVYGEPTRRERREFARKLLAGDVEDTDVLGWGVPGLSSIRRLGRGAYGGIRRSITAPLSLARRGITMPAGMVYRRARGVVPGMNRPAPQQSPDDSEPYAQDPGPQPYPQDSYPADPNDPYAADPYASQGDHDMNHNEEEMERLGLDSDLGSDDLGSDDLGWGIPGLSSIKKLAKGTYKYGKKGVMAPVSLASKGVRKLGRGIMHFVPKRDAGKAKLVRDLNTKLTVEHANWLALQDQRAGRPLQSPARYAAVSKIWSIQKIKQGGLPTNYVMGRDEILGAEIMGGDVIGSWWNPISWFSEKSTVIVNQTQGERSAVGPDGMPVGPDGQPQPLGPDGQPLPIGPDGQPMNPDGTPYSADPYAQDPYAQTNPYAAADPYAADPYAADPYATQGSLTQGEDMSTGISGEDSLGAFATEILSGVSSPTTKPETTKADQLINLGVIKLRSGKPLTPGEVGIIAKLAQSGHPRAKRVYDVLMTEGIAVSAGDDSGAWLYKLNPSYWLKSADEKKFTGIEKEKWIENAKLQKELGKRKETLEQAERAKSAAEAVAQAKAQAASTEQQLKAIEASLAGELIRDLNADVNGVFGSQTLVGHEKPTAVTAVIRAALAKSGKEKSAQALYAKIAAGEPLSPEEVKDTRQIARLLSKIKVVHGDLMTEADDPALVMHGAFVGACVLGNIQTARAHNARCQKAADVLSNRIASGKQLTPVEEKATAALITDTAKLREFTKSHVTGGAFVGLDNKAELCGTAFVGAVKVMSPAEKKMLSAIVKLAKAGNPRAIKGLAQLKKSGEIMGGDFVGTFLSDTFKAVTMPITVPAKYLYRGAKRVGQALGIVSKGGPASPESIRLSQMRAAAQRRAAFAARARAADAQTEAELRAQQSIADAADAEAEAADAEALAKEAAMRTKEIEADPSQAATDEDSSGEFVGSWNQFVGYDSRVKDPFDPAKKLPYDPKVKDPFETQAQKVATAKAIRERKIVAKAAEKSATGMKIRSGATLYAKAHRGDEKAKAAIRTMVAKAKKGDQQAIADTRAVQAGRLAVLAKEKAKKREVVALVKDARKKKVIAFQKKMEAAAANKLARAERRHNLKKLAIVERKAAAGSPKHRAYVAKQVAAAKKGDTKAQSRVRGMQLAKSVRVAAPTKRERRNLIAAQKLVERAQKGDPKAIRQIRVLQASAKAGNPNAKRAMARLAIGGALAATIATGVVVLAKKDEKKKKKGASKADHAQVLARAKAKKNAGTASREELAAGARAAQALGDKKSAGELAVAATNTPSTTEQLKKTATVVAAKEAGNEEAKKAIVDSLNAAKTGDPAAIKKTANVVAVQTIDDLNKGQPISPTMRDAINLNERIKAGDPSAIEESRKITVAATSENPIPEATMAAVGLTAAVALDKALASKPKAKAELMEKVNPPLAVAEKTEADAKINELVAKANAGTITPEEGLQGVRLAERLNRPKLAAEIAAKAPPYVNDNPMSTLPDMPLAPITGVWELFKESLKAFTFSTRDPLANYRGGIASRSREQAAVVTTGAQTLGAQPLGAQPLGAQPLGTQPLSVSGWSPFAFFRKYAPFIAPVAASTAAAASISNLIASKQHKPAPAPVPPQAPAAPATQAPVATVQAVAPTAPTEAPTAASEGDEPMDVSALVALSKVLEERQKQDLQDRAAHGDEKAIALIKRIKVNREMGHKIMESVRENNRQLVNQASKGDRQAIEILTKRDRALPISAKIDTSLLGESPLPDEVKTRIRREIEEEGILPPTTDKKKHGKTGQVSSLGSKTLGEDKSFKEYIREAVKTKKMTKTDFNKAMEVHLGPKASKETKISSGEKVLKFLAVKGVKVEQ